MVQAIVFDFDGVIANSEPLHFRAFRDVLADEGVVLAEADYYAHYLGFDDDGVFAAVGADRRRPWSSAEMERLMERKSTRFEEIERGESPLFPGAREAIHRLGGRCPLAIASGALRADIMRVLSRTDLTGYFTAIVAAEDTPASKPAPDPYLRAVVLLSAAHRQPLAPTACVAVEDSRWGLDSARAAGLKTVAVTHTYSADALAGADAIVGNLDALTWELLSSLVPSDSTPASR